MIINIFIFISITLFLPSICPVSSITLFSPFTCLIFWLNLYSLDFSLTENSFALNSSFLFVRKCLYFILILDSFSGYKHVRLITFSLYLVNITPLSFAFYFAIELCMLLYIYSVFSLQIFFQLPLCLCCSSLWEFFENWIAGDSSRKKLCLLLSVA